MLFDDMFSGRCHSFLIETRIAVTASITTVLMSVAKFELISETPIFPNMAVNAAKKAEPSANNSQLETIFIAR